MSKFKAVVIDDQKIVSEAMSELLIKTGYFNNVDFFFNTRDAEDYLDNEDCDFLVTDFVMPNVSEFISKYKKKNSSLNVIVVSANTNLIDIQDVFSGGANAFLSKYVDSSELYIAIAKILNGEKYVSSDLAVKFAFSRHRDARQVLTKREIEILVMVAKGYSINSAAMSLNLSPHTVTSHRRNIMEKLNRHSAGELIIYAYENQLVSLTEA